MTLALMLAAVQATATPQATEQWQPKPPVVTPGAGVDAMPPSDAIRLFDGRDLSQWVSVADGKPAGWTVAGGAMTVAQGAGNIETRRRFGSYQLHLEFRIPADVTGEGQGRGNSGLFLASTGPGDEGYELQILDSYRNDTYVNGQAGALYKQHAPLANPARPPGAWQSLDVVWHPPVFAPGGTVIRPAFVTALMNGVLVQDRAVLKGPTLYVGTPGYRPHGPSPIKLQAHGAPVSFRNIWVRAIPD
ncbi:hypothetical protein GGQ80_001910 [Sphingomonas jinjuensis]|uniref:3-keto-alpha-glucoside-1,2-lyase/3-keto-2-hydroxy-glucal hydratase domain-containing protein n=1 Tax=Sphingomonas jinjuensis TaxID=535907 RepID=A0A840F7R8_9SPHN|nr:DUF1080 domain-containing protein [Sphingomonas jinjuensis]MBB4154000.1 hypothetical protein [Sphingomonas jinjuensis]